MKLKYTLSKLFPDGKTFRVNYLDGNIVKLKNVRFEYGSIYETEDVALIKSVKGLTQRFPDNASNRAWLDSIGVPYNQVPCQACGGRVIKLEAHLFDFKEV